ncbi:hypothetical protein M9Y10_045882 [Tritrichomonas musculus]|uniref:Surface antigen BspA-like n=1 Tax=Tritrichomonas musculus TaxID=1915356 RepID=A0ABR2JWU0_9EUKA
MNNHNINSLIFSEDSELQIIGKRAFSQSSLTKITIPKSVTRIEEKAFYLSELLEIIIPEDSKLEWIGPSAFSFSYITEIFLPKKIRIIEEKTFDSCSSLFYVHFPNDSELISICENGFSWGRMDSFYFPQNLSKIGENWAICTTDLTYVTIDPLNPYFKYFKIDEDFQMIIGKYDQNSEVYDTLVFAPRVTLNGEGYSTTFDLEIPSFIKYISSCAFSGCNNIDNVMFEEKSELISIGVESFSHSSLKKISIPASCTRIEENAFSSCQFLHKVEFEEGSKLEYIGKNAFSHSTLHTLIFPEKVEIFENNWCNYISKLINISVPLNSVNMKIIDSKILIGKSKHNDDIEFDMIIFVARDIKQVKIPSFVKYIKSCAFFDCTNLKLIEFEENSQLISIENNAFYNCSFERIAIPKNVRSIGCEAFHSCGQLKTIEFSEGSKLTLIDTFAFSYSLIKSLVIPPNVEILKEGWNASTPNLVDVSVSPRNKNFIFFKYKNNSMIIGKSDKSSSIFDNLVFVNFKVKCFVIPSFIKHICGFTFTGIPSCNEIEFEENSQIISVGTNAFGKSNLENIALPKNANKFAERMFEDCRYLKTVELLGDDVFIEGNCFYLCYNLFIVSLPNARILTIAYSALENGNTNQHLSLFIYSNAEIIKFPSNFDD